jgi:hypothetical protein
MVYMLLRVRRSHTRHVWSSLPVATWCPLGEKLIASTCSVVCRTHNITLTNDKSRAGNLCRRIRARGLYYNPSTQDALLCRFLLFFYRFSTVFLPFSTVFLPFFYCFSTVFLLLLYCFATVFLFIPHRANTREYDFRR